MSNTTESPKVHEGRNLKRIREILQVKQTTLATLLGEDWNQKKISQLEDKEMIDPKVLEDVAKALNVSPEAIKNFKEDVAIQVIANTFNSNDSSTLNAVNHSCTFNPIEKIVELYDALLKEKDEKIALMQRLVQEKK